MYLNRSSKAFDIGHEVLCMLPLDAEPVELRPMLRDFNVAGMSQSDLKSMAEEAAHKHGIGLDWTNAEKHDKRKVGRLVAARPESLARLRHAAEEYWAKVYS